MMMIIIKGWNLTYGTHAHTKVPVQNRFTHYIVYTCSFPYHYTHKCLVLVQTLLSAFARACLMLFRNNNNEYDRGWTAGWLLW